MIEPIYYLNLAAVVICSFDCAACMYRHKAREAVLMGVFALMNVVCIVAL